MRDAEVSHRWQSADAPGAEKRQQAEGRRTRIVLLALFAIAGGLIVFYVRSLLLSPVLTPVVIVTGGPYPSPFAPNAWAATDAAALADLDGKTLSVRRTSRIRDLESQLRSVVEKQRGCKAVVIVLSMHGGVDEAGNPCLIPPSASPLEPKTWIPLSVVLAHIQKSGIADHVVKLLVLDCNRVRVAWEQGTIYNLFTESLEASQVISKSGIPNLVVLNSVRPGQRGWATEHLQGTVFGHFFRQGIAGAADSKTEGGNGDRSVSFHELRRYLDHHVDHWVRHHLAERQRPLVLASDGTGRDSAGRVRDFHVAWAVRGSIPEKNLSEPVVSQTEIDKYWEQHDRFREFDPAVYDPVTWAEFQRTLLRLQRTAAAGPGYDVMTRKAQARLNDLAIRLTRQQTRASRPDTLYERMETFSQFAGPRVQSLNVYSLPLSKYLGSLTADEIKSVSTLLGDFQQSPNSETLRSHLNDRSAKTAIPDLDEVQFLRLMHRYRIADLWQEADMSRLVTLRNLAAKAAVPTDERVHLRIQAALADGDRSRRLAEDAIFAGPENLKGDWERHRKTAIDAYLIAQSVAKSTEDAYRLRDRVSAELPWLANWLLHRPAEASRGASAPGVPADSPGEILFRLIRAKRELSATLRKPGGSLSEVFNRVQNDFESLNTLYDKECEFLLNEERADAKTLHRIRAVLRIPLVPAGQRAARRKSRVDVRRRLRRAAGTIAQNLHQTYKPVTARTSQDDSGDSASDLSDTAAELLIRLDLLERLGQSSIHPALSLIGERAELSKPGPAVSAPETERDSTSRVGRLAAANNRFRKRLLQIAENIGRTQSLAETDPMAYRAA
ncbi:MAG: hypothetical protein IID45_10415, partial [Planctomycetes bacterium]|nr:hypothetical protein [Planctomycetota bacterium]